MIEPRDRHQVVVLPEPDGPEQGEELGWPCVEAHAATACTGRSSCANPLMATSPGRTAAATAVATASPQDAC